MTSGGQSDFVPVCQLWLLLYQMTAHLRAITVGFNSKGVFPVSNKLWGEHHIVNRKLA